MYVAVIGATALITVIGISALTSVRIEARAVHGGGDFLEAMAYARSAIELGQYRMRSDANWRANLINGIWDLNRPIGSGFLTVEGIDPVDGILSNATGDPLILRGTGMKGDARYQLQVKLQTTGQPLTCLQSALHAQSGIAFTGANVTSTGAISSNAGISAGSTSFITAPVQAVGLISGGMYLSTKTSPITAKTMPGSDVFDFYTTPSNGTAISIDSIPKSQGIPTIQNVLISAASNPYGTANSNGIYVIDCRGGSLRIRNARIIGTLVILDPGAFTVAESINWQAAIANYPALMVRGSATLSFTSTALIQNLLSYASEISGLVYVSNQLTTSSSTTIIGSVVVGNTVSTQGTMNLTYSPLYLSSPPPGFGTSGGDMQIVAGTWKRVVN